MPGRRRLIPLVALAVALPLPALARDEPDDPCPKALVCVEHDGYVFEVDPDDGAMVGFVTELIETEVTNLTGTETERGGSATWFARQGASYVVVADGVSITEAQAAKPAELGDVLLPRLDR